MLEVFKIINGFTDFLSFFNNSVNALSIKE